MGGNRREEACVSTLEDPVLLLLWLQLHNPIQDLRD